MRLKLWVLQRKYPATNAGRCVGGRGVPPGVLQKSAQGTDSKRFAGNTVFERVRKRVKGKEIVEPGERRKGWRPLEARGERTFILYYSILVTSVKGYLQVLGTK